MKTKTTEEVDRYLERLERKRIGKKVFLEDYLSWEHYLCFLREETEPFEIIRSRSGGYDVKVPKETAIKLGWGNKELNTWFYYDRLMDVKNIKEYASKLYQKENSFWENYKDNLRLEGAVWESRGYIYRALDISSSISVPEKLWGLLNQRKYSEVKEFYRKLNADRYDSQLKFVILDKRETKEVVFFDLTDMSPEAVFKKGTFAPAGNFVIVAGYSGGLTQKVKEGVLCRPSPSDLDYGVANKQQILDYWNSWVPARTKHLKWLVIHGLYTNKVRFLNFREEG